MAHQAELSCRPCLTHLKKPSPPHVATTNGAPVRRPHSPGSLLSRSNKKKPVAPQVAAHNVCAFRWSMLPSVPHERQGLCGGDSCRTRTRLRHPVRKHRRAARTFPMLRLDATYAQSVQRCTLDPVGSLLGRSTCKHDWAPTPTQGPAPANGLLRPRASSHVLSSVQGERLEDLQQELRNSVLGRSLEEHLRHEPFDELECPCTLALTCPATLALLPPGKSAKNHWERLLRQD